ncbi:MAG: RNAase P [Thermoplasmata archaeon]|nr:RNAase P [Thermoplasmata archaeon]
MDWRKKKARRIAWERIQLLFTLALEEVKKGNVVRVNRYIEHILKLSRKYNIRLPREMKMYICKKCHSFLIPGKTSQVRLKKGKIVIKCLKCGSYKRYIYKK